MWFLMLEFGTETCRKGGKSSEESHSLFLLLMARDLLEDLQRDSAVEASLFPFNGQGDGIKSLAARLDELLSPPAGSPPPSAELPPSAWSTRQNVAVSDPLADALPGFG
jgi:hypothetical protein